MFFKIPFWRVTMPVTVPNLASVKLTTKDFNSFDEARDYFDSELERLSAISPAGAELMTPDEIIELEHGRFQRLMAFACIEEIRFPAE